jgi:hypothetical protein
MTLSGQLATFVAGPSARELLRIGVPMAPPDSERTGGRDVG